MPLPAFLLILAALLPLAGCLTLLPLGRRLGTPLAGYVATFFIAASFLCSGWGMLGWLTGGNYHGQPYGKLSVPINLSWRFAPIGGGGAPNGFEQDHPGWLDFSIYIDSLTFALFVTVTLTAMIVHIFAVRSLRRDPRFARFFTCLSFTCFTTLAFFLSGTLAQMVILLELLGFAVSMLIAFRADAGPAVRASGKMFIVSRIGDIGLLLGIGILVSQVGNLSLPDLWLMLGSAGGGSPILLPGGAVFPTGLLTTAGIALFFGAAARCAQFPLHVWAGDVAEGVAPAVAMVFVAGLSTAGIFLIARIFPLLTPSARLLIAMVGATTLAMGALIATVQPDLKKVLTWIAASQLGYMVLGIGIGSWSGAMFHLVAYTFFQALLFLAAGAVVRATRGETHLSQLGGLLFKMPVTAIASGIAALAVCGAGRGSIGLSGYFSRTLILQHAAGFAELAIASHRSHAYLAFVIVPMAITLVTAFAMARWWVLIFAGKPRDQRLHDHAREATTLFWPLVIVAVMTMLAGNWLGVRDMLESSITESIHAVEVQAQSGQHYRGVAVHAFEGAWAIEEPLSDEEDRRDDSIASASTAASAALDHGREIVARWSLPLLTVGLLSGITLYLPGLRVTRRLVRIAPLSWLHAWLLSGMYFDDLYNALLVQPTLALARLISLLDRRIVHPFTHYPSPPAAQPSDSVTEP